MQMDWPTLADEVDAQLARTQENLRSCQKLLWKIHLLNIFNLALLTLTTAELLLLHKLSPFWAIAAGAASILVSYIKRPPSQKGH